MLPGVHGGVRVSQDHLDLQLSPHAHAVHDLHGYDIHVHGTFDHGHAGHGHHAHPWTNDVVAEPGCMSSLFDRHSLSDPLVDLGQVAFPAFTMPHHGAVLVDANCDGMPDHTAWGTPVHPVAPYVRADGTVVSGHYRTAPDGLRWNNLS
jgi:hypothetical protein